MPVNDGHWPATCLSLSGCQKEPAVGFDHGPRPLCSSPYYLASGAVSRLIQSVCMKNPRPECVSPVKREVCPSSFSLSLSLAFLFFFPFEWNICRWLSRGQEVECVATVRKVNCCLLWSEFQIAPRRSGRLRQSALRPALHILSAPATHPRDPT